MASTQTILLSPAELAYLHDSLSLTPPIRPDGRKPDQFRPLTAETGVLPGTNGSARVCFSDGTEAMVGIKAEIERTRNMGQFEAEASRSGEQQDRDGADISDVRACSEWVEISIEIPGYRDDESSTIFLASMLSEALVADGSFVKKLAINGRFHWKLYLDLISEGDEDPMFNDDWNAAISLYSDTTEGMSPPITLLVISVGNNIIFDPSQEELAVAETALAISVAEHKHKLSQNSSDRDIRLLAVRTVDPPSRLTPPGVANTENTAVAGNAVPVAKKSLARENMGKPEPGVWRAPQGGARFGLLEKIITKVMEKGGVVDEVLDGLAGVDLS
ncbi:Exosome complex component RRP42 [Ceratocystis platani]|uniref:Ribosomal RNA-processing protein 42 n=1 Tax=Ceratocystis fimbriata f. sp. platani TaxID=88771 RepID=A0A0F8AZ40_CERFI|nr:Exosome complex component RRP42 [Ceratocystis platani]